MGARISTPEKARVAVASRLWASAAAEGWRLPPALETGTGVVGLAVGTPPAAPPVTAAVAEVEMELEPALAVAALVGFVLVLVLPAAAVVVETAATLEESTAAAELVPALPFPFLTLVVLVLVSEFAATAVVEVAATLEVSAEGTAVPAAFAVVLAGLVLADICPRPRRVEVPRVLLSPMLAASVPAAAVVCAAAVAVVDVVDFDPLPLALIGFLVFSACNLLVVVSTISAPRATSGSTALGSATMVGARFAVTVRVRLVQVEVGVALLSASPAPGATRFADATTAKAKREKSVARMVNVGDAVRKRRCACKGMEACSTEKVK